MTRWSSPVVYCDVEDIELPGQSRPVPSVRATCDRCGHKTESYGRGDGSVKRCLATMREGCPKDESNFYEEGKRIALQASGRVAVAPHTVAPDAVARILICTAMADKKMEPEVQTTLQRYLKKKAEIVGSSALNWNLVRANEGGWDGAYRWVTDRYDLFCLVGHSETGGLSKGVYTIAESAERVGRGLVLWTPLNGGTLQRMTGVRKTYGDWKKDFGEAIIAGETASPPPLRIDPDDVPF